MKHSLLSAAALVSLLAAAVPPAQAQLTEDADTAQQACINAVAPIVFKLSEDDINNGMADVLTSVCLVGYEVSQAGDEQTNADNLERFNSNLADPRASLTDALQLKNAYLLGYNLGMTRG
ncbi:MAG: hypothetical protein RR068_07485 [Hafnia sp.]